MEEQKVPVAQPPEAQPEPVKRGRGRPKGSKNKAVVCPKCGTVIE